MSTLSEAAGAATADPATPTRGDAAFDLPFETFFGGGLGGSAVALFFLVLDSLQGQPLYTPSLLGTVLFTDQAATAVTQVQVDMVAFYSLVHFAVFGAAAALISKLRQRATMLQDQPLLIAGLAFAILTLGLLIADAVVMPGVVMAIGIVPILAANAVAGITMAVFFRWAQRQVTER